MGIESVGGMADARGSSVRRVGRLVLPRGPRRPHSLVGHGVGFAGDVHRLLSNACVVDCECCVVGKCAVVAHAPSAPFGLGDGTRWGARFAHHGSALDRKGSSGRFERRPCHRRSRLLAAPRGLDPCEFRRKNRDVGRAAAQGNVAVPLRAEARNGTTRNRWARMDLGKVARPNARSMAQNKNGHRSAH